MRRPAIVAALVLLLGAGCAPSDSSAPEGTTATWTVSGEPRFAIGGTDMRENYQLFRVRGATMLSDGRLVVGNSGSSELRYFSSDGDYLSASGGDGEGPGEMRSLMEIVPLDGDSLLTLSFRPGFIRWGPDGEYIDSQLIDLWSVGVPCRIGEGNWHGLPDGSMLTLYEDNFAPSGCPAAPPSPYRATGLIARTDLNTGQFDTLAILPGTERNLPNYRVFGKMLEIAWDATSVYASDTGAPEILKLGMNGDTLAVWPTPFEAEVIPAEAKRQEIREFERDGAIVRGEPYIYPEHYPRVGRLLLARTGELWVMAYPPVLDPISSPQLTNASFFRVEEGGARWRVLDQSGAVIADVRTPEGVFPLEVGSDYLIGLSRDDTDLETVAVYDLVR